MAYRSVTLSLPLLLVLSLSACSEATTEPQAAAPAAAPPASRPAPAPGTFAGESKTLTVAGEYMPLALDRVATVSVEGNRLVVHGSSSNVAVDLPAGADASRITRHWALVTETFLEDGRRSVTFTHSQSLDEFTIQLPIGSGTVRYGGFEGREGPEVLVLAWGEESAVYWGWLTIAEAAGAAVR